MRLPSFTKEASAPYVCPPLGVSGEAEAHTVRERYCFLSSEQSCGEKYALMSPQTCQTP